MARREHHALSVGRGTAEPPACPAARVDDRLRADLHGAAARLALDRRARRVLDEVEDPVERTPVLQTRQSELLVRVVVQEQLRVPTDVVEGMGRPAGDEPGEERSLELRAGHAAGLPRLGIEPRQTADVGFDNVGRHRPGSLTRGTGWTCGTRTSW
jgi:hypothetical protein